MAKKKYYPETLKGREDEIRAIVERDGLGYVSISKQLGVSISHARYAMAFLGLKGRSADRGIAPPLTQKSIIRARAVEMIEAGVPYQKIANTLGYKTAKSIKEIAREEDLCRYDRQWSEEQREMFKAMQSAGKSVAEIAEATGKSADSVKARIATAGRLESRVSREDSMIGKPRRCQAPAGCRTVFLIKADDIDEVRCPKCRAAGIEALPGVSLYGSTAAMCAGL